ncbi:hypothetical protein DL96DRAFT_1716117 [Flagelloscypha sp. PMI_526]|nr:hypothetical protein DL96DRAFT_1716117 [Flagelloscypha sp. PMI_526]
MGIKVNYPITRPFPSRLFAIVTYIVAFLLLVLLVVVNAALAGYETVTVFADSYNATRPLWFHKFLLTQAPKPGTLCDSKLFNVGDTLSTNYSIFQWQIEYIYHANAGSSSLAYKGTPLDGCDVTSIYLDADLHSWNVDVTSVMTCKPADGSYEISARTSYAISGLSGIYRPILGVTGASDPRNASSALRGDGRAALINLMTVLSGVDVLNRMASRLTIQNLSSPVRVSLAVDIPWCPQSMASNACSTTPPTFTIREADAVFVNISLVQLGTTDIDFSDPAINYFYQPVANLIQTVYASSRVDLGIASPNNILTTDGAWRSTINTTFAASSGLPSTESRLGHLFSTPGDFTLSNDSTVPLSTSGTAEIRVVYPCKFQQRKKAANAVFAVISATAAMFTAVWGVFIVVASSIVKRDIKANECSHTCVCMDLAFMRDDRFSNPDLSFVRDDRFSRPFTLASPTSERTGLLNSR